MVQREDGLRFIDEKDPSEWTEAEWDAYEAYVASLPEADEAYDNATLRERYKRLRAELRESDPAELLARLRKSAFFWDDELAE
jgi:hypothetical protein